MMNYLVGKENIEEEFKFLIKKDPQIIKLIPVVIASREKSFKILVDFKNGECIHET